jgi:hypothetical protein
MKKFLSLMLAILMLTSVMAISVSAQETDTGDTTTEGTVPTQAELIEMKLRAADVNKDGSYSTEDASAVLKAAAGIIPENENYDVNLDSNVSVKDAIKMLRIISGVEKIITDEEALTLFNSKLNACKSDEPGFTKTSTATCYSMKITQSVKASNALIGAMLKDMEFTDLEYDKYVDKMVAMMGSGDKLTEAEKQQIADMKKSAEDYRKPQVQTYTAEKGSYYSHYRHFPREYKNVASELLITDISSISYTMVNGNICFIVKLPKSTYTTNYPSDDSQTPYGRVFNLVDFTSSDGSKINSLVFNNGKITMYFDAVTGAMKTVDYSYDYSSSIKAPTQTQSDSSIGTVTIDVTTKTNASIKEEIVF